MLDTGSSMRQRGRARNPIFALEILTFLSPHGVATGLTSWDPLQYMASPSLPLNIALESILMGLAYRFMHNLVFDPAKLALRTLQGTPYPYQNITRAIDGNKLSSTWAGPRHGGGSAQESIQPHGEPPKVADAAIRPQE